MGGPSLEVLPQSNFRILLFIIEEPKNYIIFILSNVLHFCLILAFIVQKYFTPKSNWLNASEPMKHLISQKEGEKVMGEALQSCNEVIEAKSNRSKRRKQWNLLWFSLQSKKIYAGKDDHENKKQEIASLRK